MGFLDNNVDVYPQSCIYWVVYLRQQNKPCQQRHVGEDRDCRNGASGYTNQVNLYFTVNTVQIALLNNFMFPEAIVIICVS